MKLFITLLLCLFIGLAYQQTAVLCPSCMAPFQLTFQTVGSNTQYRRRLTRGQRLNTNLVVGGQILSRSVTRVNGERTVDLVRSAAFAINGIMAPTCSMAFWNKEAEATNGTNGYDFQVNGSGNYIATRYYSLEEVTPSGVVVNRILFRNLQWSEVASSSGSDNGVPFFSMTATSTGASYGSVAVELSFIASSETATLELVLNGTAGFLKTLVSSKSVETIVVLDLRNYVYQNATNSVRVSTYTATGSAQRSANVSSPNPITRGQVYSYITSQNGTDTRFQIGVRFAGFGYLARTGNTSVGFQFNTTSDTSVFNGDNVGAQVSAKFGTSGTVTYVPIIVPAGVQDIFYYDPSTVSGNDPAAQSSLNSAASPLVFSFALLALLLFFF